jgi:hypothetical protein
MVKGCSPSGSVDGGKVVQSGKVFPRREVLSGERLFSVEMFIGGLRLCQEGKVESIGERLFSARLFSVGEVFSLQETVDCGKIILHKYVLSSG